MAFAVVAPTFVLAQAIAPADNTPNRPPLLDKLNSVQELAEVHKLSDDFERSLLKESHSDRNKYCRTMLELVFFRYELYRTSATAPVIPIVDARGGQDRQYLHGLFEANVLRAEELFSQAEKTCVPEMAKTENYRKAEFANAWLLDNVRTSLTPTYYPKALDQQRTRVLQAYESVLTALRLSTDKNWIDPLLLLYSYSNALLIQAQFEKAQPLLDEALEIGTGRYGRNSPKLLPVLRLAAGISYAVNDQPSYERYLQLIKAAGGPPVYEKILFDLRMRATGDSVKTLKGERPVFLMGTREEVEGRLNRKFPVEDRTADLPTAAGQAPRRSREIVGLASGGTLPITAFITVDETGKVIDIDIKSGSEKMRSQITEVVRGLTFAPVRYQGRPSSMKGYVKIPVNSR